MLVLACYALRQKKKKKPIEQLRKIMILNAKSG